MLFLCRLNNNFERLHFVIFSFFLIFEDPHATLPPIPQIINRKIRNPRVWRIWEDRFFFPKIFEGQKMNIFWRKNTSGFYLVPVQILKVAFFKKENSMGIYEK